jgi:hypothetical protein
MAMEWGLSWWFLRQKSAWSPPRVPPLVPRGLRSLKLGFTDLESPSEAVSQKGGFFCNLAAGLELA